MQPLHTYNLLTLTYTRTHNYSWTWTHGTRLGVPLSGEQGLHDWWGSRDDVLRRGPERHSVVFAFAAAEEESGGGGGSGA